MVSCPVDGGSENNNQIVDSFLDQKTISIKKIIAQKDIHFSNSMIEAYNKILKYRCLYLYNIFNFKALIKHLKKFIPIYNTIRPHISLKGLTPFESFSGKSVKSVFNFYNPKEEYNKRILDNQNSSCSLCE